MPAVSLSKENAFSSSHAPGQGSAAPRRAPRPPHLSSCVPAAVSQPLSKARALSKAEGLPVCCVGEAPPLAQRKAIQGHFPARKPRLAPWKPPAAPATVPFPTEAIGTAGSRPLSKVLPTHLSPHLHRLQSSGPAFSPRPHPHPGCLGPAWLPSPCHGGRSPACKVPSLGTDASLGARPCLPWRGHHRAKPSAGVWAGPSGPALGLPDASSPAALSGDSDPLLSAPGLPASRRGRASSGSLECLSPREASCSESAEPSTAVGG